MILENEIKLDFKDVLIRPKRSNLTSRLEVDVEREFVFKHSLYKWKGVPIILCCNNLPKVLIKGYIDKVKEQDKYADIIENHAALMCRLKMN